LIGYDLCQLLLTGLDDGDHLVDLRRPVQTHPHRTHCPHLLGGVGDSTVGGI